MPMLVGCVVWVRVGIEGDELSPDLVAPSFDDLSILDQIDFEGEDSLFAEIVFIDKRVDIGAFKFCQFD